MFDLPAAGFPCSSTAEATSPAFEHLRYRSGREDLNDIPMHLALAHACRQLYPDTGTSGEQLQGISSDAINLNLAFLVCSRVREAFASEGVDLLEIRYQYVPLR
jgi:hypothetical protein